RGGLGAAGLGRGDRAGRCGRGARRAVHQPGLPGVVPGRQERHPGVRRLPGLLRAVLRADVRRVPAAAGGAARPAGRAPRAGGPGRVTGGAAMTRTVVVVGHGPVGHRLASGLRAADATSRWRVVVLGEEPRPAYDRVALSSYLDGATAADLDLTDPDFH